MSDFNDNENTNNCDEKNNVPLNVDIDAGEAVSKTYRTVSLQTFIVSVVAIVLAAVMLTYTVCTMVYHKKVNEAYLGIVQNGTADSYDKLDLIRELFHRYSLYDLDDEAMLDAVIGEYVRATGDRYAYYYNAEQYAAHLQSAAGNAVGIGVTVTGGTVEVDGFSYAVIDIVEVVEDGPADVAGIKAGDKIAWLGKKEDALLVGDMASYSEAVAYLQGEDGTMVDLGVFRDNGNGYETVFLSVKRGYVERPTVVYGVSDTSSKVGVVKITKFAYSTPRQFKEAVDSLLDAGCENFVFDVRDNPGGSIDSVSAVLSYLLPSGTTLLSTVDSSGNTNVINVTPVTHLEGSMADCNVPESDIGKYVGKIKNMAVLCNGDSASAAELFAANFRDNSLGILVGEKTYGKGSVQSVISLSPYGYSGGLRLTSKMYFPPCGISYDGIGLEPTENYKISLSDEALQYPISALPEQLDDQLLLAIRSFE